MAERHHVYLVPGFFGFANFGELKYFAHVHEVLASWFADHGVDAAVHPVPTLPTASLRRRAAVLLANVAATAEGDGPIHLIGHSSGGLDARLMVTPGVSLDGEVQIDAEPWAARVRSVVSVAAPHRGTPSATFFTTLYGKRMLQVLSLLTVRMLGIGRLPLSVVATLAGIASRLDDPINRRRDALDQLNDQLLSDFSPERRDALQHFFAQVLEDQRLLPQLTPESMDIFNAGTPDRPGVRYGSIVTAARRPGVGTAWSAGTSPTAQATHALYVALHTLTAFGADQVPELPRDVLSRLSLAYRRTPDRRSSDGMVPTLSQPWGEVLYCARADHLDVMGHFDDSDHDPPHFDWLHTGSGFRRAEFENLWGAAARFLVGKPADASAAGDGPGDEGPNEGSPLDSSDDSARGAQSDAAATAAKPTRH